MKLNQLLNIVNFLITRTTGEHKAVPWTVFSDVLTKINLEYFYSMVAKEAYDYLRPFLVSYGEEGEPSLEVDSYGIVNLPTDFYKPVSIFYNHVKDGQTTKVDIEIKDESTFDLLHSDPIENPTLKYPICVVRESEIKIAPKEILYIGMKYYRVPPTPVYAIKVENQVNVYDEDNSTELLWKEPELIHIIRLLLVDMGYHVTPQAVQEAVTQEKKK